MKLKYRPMALMGFSSLIVLFLCTHFDDRFSFFSIILGVLILLVTVLVPKFRHSVIPFFIAASLIFTGISFEALSDYKISDAEELTNQNVYITATVLEEPEFNGSRYYYILKTKDIDGNQNNAKLRLSTSNIIDAEPYDTVKLSVHMYDLGSSSRDIKLYYQSKGIFYGAYISNYDDDYPIEIIKSDKKPIGYYFYQIRSSVKDRILDKLPNDYGAICVGMLIGDKDNISNELYQNIRTAGVAPLFAVSGLHLSVWVMGLYSVLELLNVKKRLNSLIGISFTLFFMAVTGFSPSVCRAGIMLLLILAGNLFYRRTDSLNSLGFSVLILGIVNPLITADIGFLLSFSSTLGIVILNPIFKKYVVSKIPSGILKALCELVLVSLSATIFSLGFIIVFIGYISVYTIFSNFLISYAASLCMIVSGFSFLLYPISGLGDLFAVTAGLLSKYIIFVINKVAALPLATIDTTNIYWTYGVVIFYTFAAVSMLCLNRKLAFKISCIGLAAVVTVCSTLNYLSQTDNPSVKILNVDDNIAVVISYGGHSAVICSNCDYQYLSDNISLALEGNDGTDIFIADLGHNNSSAIYKALGEIQSKKIIVPEKDGSLLSVCDEENIIQTKNSAVSLWDNASVKFVPNSDYCIAVCNINNIEFTVLLRYDYVPDKYLTGDVLICNDVPNNAQFSRIIISGESSDLGIISTSSYGDIEFILNDNSYKIITEEGD